MPHEFINNLLKPWDELSNLLSKPYAFQPDVNDPIREGANIAVTLRHLPERTGVDVAVAFAECPAQTILTDVADAWKHGSLRDTSRNNKLSIASRFEFEGESRFRFVRNVITVAHASKGTHDLLVLEGEAISYWRAKLGIPVAWRPAIRQEVSEFQRKCVLFFNPKHQVLMSQTELQFVSRGSGGEFVFADPGLVEFEVYEVRAQAT